MIGGQDLTHIQKMINRLIGGFVSILIGVSLIGPIATTVNTVTQATGNNLTNTAAWGATVLRMVPGFFALSIMGIGIAITYGALRDAGVV
jgi:hypothetical protein